MKIFAAMVLLWGLNVMADETPTIKVPVDEGFSSMDMNEFEAAKNFKPAKGLKFKSAGCRDSTGKVHKIEDPGFQNCMMQNSANKDANMPGKSLNGSPGDSQLFEIQSGD